MKLFSRKKSDKILGLALSSGGAKGFAHIGVLQAFYEEGIDFQIIAGTSIGSVIGGVYAYGLSPQEMLDSVKKLNIAEIKKTNKLSAFLATDAVGIENAMKSIVGSVRFEDLSKKFYAVAVNLKTGGEEILSTGEIAKSISASCAISPFFKPVVIGDKHLVDGAYLNSLPADVVRRAGADFVIGVDLAGQRKYTTNSTKTLEVLLTTAKISMGLAVNKGRANCDFVITPNLEGFTSTKFEGADKMIELGYEMAKESMPDIKRKLKLAGFR